MFSTVLPVENKAVNKTDIFLEFTFWCNEPTHKSVLNLLLFVYSIVTGRSAFHETLYKKHMSV